MCAVTDNISGYSTLPSNIPPNSGPSLQHRICQVTDLDITPHLQGFEGNSIANTVGPSLIDQWHATSTLNQNVENYFDELASLDGAERAESQPQFMQNLGFAPDARISDLLTSDFEQLNAILGYPT